MGKLFQPETGFPCDDLRGLNRLWAEYERVGITCDWQYPAGVLCTLLVPT